MDNTFSGIQTNVHVNVIRFINRNMDIVIYQPEDFIITQGSLSESLFFLAIGHLKVTIVDEK